MFKPLVDIRARIYDMAHDPDKAGLMTYEENGEKFATGLKLPYTQEDWWKKTPRDRRRVRRCKRRDHSSRGRDGRGDVVSVRRPRRFKRS